MYTKYATQFHMAAHLKRANCIQIHDSMMDMAVSLASQVSAVKASDYRFEPKVLIFAAIEAQVAA